MECTPSTYQRGARRRRNRDTGKERNIMSARTDPKMRIDVGRENRPEQMRAVHLGRVDRLADVFTHVERRAFGDPTPTIVTLPMSDYDRKRRNAPCHVSGYATMKLRSGYPRHHGANVEVSDDVMRVIREWMIHPGNDTISFEVIEWDNGDALVMARNSVILGDTWIAFLAPSALAELREALSA